MDRPAKRERLDAHLAAEELEAVWLAQPASFAWLTGGSNVVVAEDPTGVAAVGYDGSSFSVVTDNIESDRLRDEELPAGIDVTTFEWYASDLERAVRARSPQPAAADFPVTGFDRLDPSSLRQPLTAADIDRYRRLGRESASALEAACDRFTDGMTERDLAADISQRMIDREIRTPVVLVGSGRRAQTYRHFTPTDAPIDDYALVSVTAARGGLYASLTRIVTADPPAWLWDRYRAVAAVETAALAATRRVGSAGGTAREIFDEIRAAYESAGHAGEWRNHHQGGAAGYAGREWFATPESTDAVHLPMAYAWNPTVAGAKSENTWLVSADGIECLTPGGWGSVTIETPDGTATVEHPVPSPSFSP